MANYRDLLSDTIGKISGAVSEYTNGKSAKDLYNEGMERVSGIGKTAKAVIDLNSECEELNRVYAEIGRLYYEEAGDSAGEFYVPLFEQVSEIKDRIAEKRKIIDDVKKGILPTEEPGVDDNIIEFDKIVDASAEEAIPQEEEPKEEE